MNQYSGFTPRAASVLAGAQQAAQGMGHTYIGSEHLLLALLREGAGAAYTLLTQRRITAAKTERLLLQMVGRGHPTLLCAEDATEHYRAALEEALQEAQAGGFLQAGICCWRFAGRRIPARCVCCAGFRSMYRR